MMRYLLFFVVLATACVRTPDKPRTVYHMIDHIGVIDVLNGKLVPDQKVVIKDSLIEFVGDQWAMPADGIVDTISGAGKFVIPGMWDMHMHVCWDMGNDSLVFPVLLSMGITGVRDMGGDLRVQNAMKQRIAEDPTSGPVLFGPGPIIDGNPPVHKDFTIAVDSSTRILTILDSLVRNGADFIKVYSMLRDPELAHIAGFSKKHNIPFAGHLSEYINPINSIRLGQKSIEHLNRLDDMWMRDSVEFSQLTFDMEYRTTWVCPTLIIYYVKDHMADSSVMHPEYTRYILPTLLDDWKASKERRLSRVNNADTTGRAQMFAQREALVAYLYHRGVGILAGTDFGGMPYVYPGLGLLQELDLLHEAGLSNAEVVTIATLNPARYFSIDDKYGTVSAGKYADLVLLNGNPLEDLRNLRTVKVVFRHGRPVDLLRHL